MLSFDETAEFQKDVKALKKKWRSIPADIESAKLVIEKLYVPVKDVNIDEFRKQFFATRRAAVLRSGDGHEVIKMRLDCKSLGNDKKTRLVFVMARTDSTVTLIELYAKNDKETHDSGRLKRYL